MSLSALNTRILKPDPNWTLFRRDCKVLLEGRENRTGEMKRFWGYALG